MKKLNKSLFAALLIVATLSSCTMEKRQFMPGYSVQWFSHQHAGKLQAAQPIPRHKTKALASLDADDVVAQQIEANSNPEAAQMLTASSEPTAMLIKVNIHTTPKTSVACSAVRTASVTNDIKPSQSVVKADSRTQAERKAAKPAPSSGKSQVIALILCAIPFLGLLGIHRFYLGYTWQGIAMIFLTLLFGLGVIWWLIDLVRII